MELRDLIIRIAENLIDNPDIRGAVILDVDEYFESQNDKYFPNILKKTSKDFHEWMVKENWYKHSSGEYYYRNFKDFSKWPPDETSTFDELYNEFNES